MGVRGVRLQRYDVALDDDGPLETNVAADRLQARTDAPPPPREGRAIAALGAWVGACKTLRELSLRDVNLKSTRGALSRGVASAPRLEVLDLAGNPVCDDDNARSERCEAPALAEAVASSKVARLRLGARELETRSLLRSTVLDLSSDPTAFSRLEVAVMAGLLSRNERLHRLACRGLFRGDVSKFDGFLEHLRPAPSLKHLDLSENGLGGTGAESLRAWLVQRRLLGGSRALESLALRDDDLDAAALEVVLLGDRRRRSKSSPDFLRDEAGGTMASDAASLLNTLRTAPDRHGPTIRWLQGCCAAAGFEAEKAVDACARWLRRWSDADASADQNGGLSPRSREDFDLELEKALKTLPCAAVADAERTSCSLGLILQSPSRGCRQQSNAAKTT